MSQSVLDVDEDFFARNPSKGSGPAKSVHVPDSLRGSTHRLAFPPSYVVVGVYRLLSDKALFLPVWEKCRNGFLRGIAVGGVWVRTICVSKTVTLIEWLTLSYSQSFLTFSIQRGLIKTFWLKYVDIVHYTSFVPYGCLILQFPKCRWPRERHRPRVEAAIRHPNMFAFSPFLIHFHG